MALAVAAPFLRPAAPFFRPSAPVPDKEADGNAAYGATGPPQPDGPTSQNDPSPANDRRNWKIQFNQSTFGENRVIRATDVKHTITWTSPKSPPAQVTKAAWLVREDDGSFQTIKEADYKGEPSRADPFHSVPSPPSTAAKRGVPMDLWSNGLNLPLGDMGSPLQYAGSDMYIQLDWTSESESGRTTSGVFAVFSGSSSSEYDKEVDRIKSLTTTGANATVESEGKEGPMPAGDSASPTEHVSTEVPVLPSSTITGGPLAPGIATGDGAGSGGSGMSGLSPGAIAGIAIGSVFGVSLIAFLIWFLLRRRHREDHASNAAYGSGHSPHEYLADKENHARVTESPHSPYSDDGHQPQHQPEQHCHLERDDPGAVILASAIGTTERRPLAPYDEGEHTPVAARSAEDMTRSGARSSTPNVNTNVSHLIEEGMTEDEIRRLEEEERALDDAIEQAGQGQARSQGQGQGQRRQP